MEHFNIINQHGKTIATASSIEIAQKYLDDAKNHLKLAPNINFFIFGHRHIMLDLMLSRTARLLIAGDWMQYFSYIVWDGETLYMEQFETE